MRQRVMIAIALVLNPALLIADEPTTALDVTIQAQILAEAQALCARTGTAMIWITHDLAVVSSLADRIAVMYAGRIVETGQTADVVNDPQHPYTKGLIDSVPSHNVRGQRLAQIPGMTPSLINLPQGCAFRTRCSRVIDACLQEPPMRELGPGRAVRCFNPVGSPEHAVAEIAS
jgi:peptide/nickel transport system ATP-binding protein